MIFLFGGTFDPVHNGHVEAALAVAERFDIPEIRMLLAARPRHRAEPETPVADRLAMLKLACAPWPQLTPDDFEVRSGGPSYTVETLARLRARHPAATLVWIMGMDAFADIHTWHRTDEVLDFCHLVVLSRVGAARPSGAALALLERHRAARLPARQAGAIVELEVELPDISASAVRARLARGEDVAHLIPPAVRTYISQHGLYRQEPSH